MNDALVRECRRRELAGVAMVGLGLLQLGGALRGGKQSSRTLLKQS